MDVIQKMDDEKHPECSHCKSDEFMKRIMKASNFHLKGGGWAKDGYS